MRRYVVIGCSAAGLAAAKEIRKGEPDAGVTVISREEQPFYFRPSLINYLTLGEKADVRSEGERFIERFELDIITGSAVTAVDINRNVYPVIRFDNRDGLQFDYLVVASGRTFNPGLVHKWRDIPFRCDDFTSARKLATILPRLESVIVCGGGYIALTLVGELRRHRKHVTFITDDYHFTPSLFDYPSRERLDAVFKRMGVTPRFVKEIVEVAGENGAEITIRDDAGSSWSAQGLIAAYPGKPAIEFLRGAGIVIGEGVKVTADLQTTALNVFAAGDCAEVLDPATSESVFNYGWRSAARMGEVAGRNALLQAAGNIPDQFVGMNGAFFKDVIQSA